MTRKASTWVGTPSGRTFPASASAAGGHHPEQIATYVNNLVRLGLLERLAVNTFYKDAEHQYREIENDPEVVTLKAVFEDESIE